MKKTKRFMVVAAALLSASVVPNRICRAVDQIGLIGEFSLPDRLRNLVDSQDEYYDAVQRLQDADAAVMRARESAMKDAQSAPDYAAAVKAMDQAYQAYIDKKNEMVSDMEKKDPVYSRMKGQVAQIDAQIEAARQNTATTPQQFEEMYKNRETFQTQWHQLEDDAMKRAGITPLQQAWADASKRLADLQDKQRLEVESNDRLKAAVTEASAAKTAVDDAHSAISGTSDPSHPEQASAADLLCKSNRTAFSGNDAWWTYGWSNFSGKTAITSAPTGGK